jgi:hypothetical protein
MAPLSSFFITIISKEAKQAYADFLRKKAKGDGAELKLREASSFAKKQTPLTPYEMKDFVFILNGTSFLIFYYFTVFIYFWLPSHCLNMSICLVMSNNMCSPVSVCVLCLSKHQPQN